MPQTDYAASGKIGVNLYQIDTTPLYKMTEECKGISGTHGPAIFRYLKGVANTAEGSVVTFDEEGVTALIAANGKGFVAVALGATVANTYGWYQVGGKAAAKCHTSSADNTTVGRENADGTIGDGRAAGDEIIGAMARSATDTPASGMCWLQLSGTPFVNDFIGA
jgi:myo-inositol-hexaphosphate 3-phosphohydrolase